MAAFCDDRATPTDFLIEKHPSKPGVDHVQSRLTCNMPDLAIHRIRCNPDFAACESMRVVPVDTRHVDTGFLRYEIVCCFEDDPAYAAAAHDFQRECYQSILALHDSTRLSKV